MKNQKIDKPVNKRFREMLEELRHNANTFAKKLGYKNGSNVYNITGIDFNTPSFDMLSRIALKFEEINLDWLITGRGKMFYQSYYDKLFKKHNPEAIGIVQDPTKDYVLLKTEDVKVSEQPISVNDPIVVEALMAMLKLQKKELDYLKNNSGSNTNAKVMDAN